jgi:hypothetical protein
MSLGLVVVSSLWHHDHSRILAAFPHYSHQNAGAPAPHSSDDCPVCLSHRLLTHACQQAIAEAPSPVISFDCTDYASIVPATSHIYRCEARAPPLC